MTEADAKFLDALRDDLQRQLGEGFEVQRVSAEASGTGQAEAIALVRAGDRIIRFRATGETIIDAYGRLLTEGHPERLPARRAP